MWPIQRKKLNRNRPGKELMADLLDKDFKTTTLNMTKEPQEDIEKGKKIMYEQNGNVNKR